MDDPARQDWGHWGRPDAVRRERDTPAKPAVELLDTADAVIKELFSVGITLESCAEHVGGETAERMRGVVVQLDAVIQRIRRAVLAHSSAPAVERLLRDARRVVELYESDSRCPANQIEVVDGVQSLHRAIVGLADAVYQAPSPAEGLLPLGGNGGYDPH